MSNTNNKSVCDQYFKNIFDAICNDKGILTKIEILESLKNVGILPSDPRIVKITNSLNDLIFSDEIDFDFFKDITSDCIALIESIVNKSLVINDFTVFKDDIIKIFEKAKENVSGKNATYIPQLARVNPDLFAMAFCSIDGQMITLGDYTHPYCVQSTSKTVTYCIATELNGESMVHNHVGREPSGVNFNAIAMNKYNLPHNPMINSGAIMTCSLIKPEDNLADRFEYITQVWNKLSGGDDVGFDNAIYHSEKESADRNYALAHYMKEVGAFPNKTNIHSSLDFYFQTCSIQVNAKMMAKSMSTLANGGVCPFNNTRVFSPTTVRNCLSMMYSCGMYDFSGEYAFSVGLPAKSGVSGALVIVAPNVGSFALFSPRLDSNHNSVRGVEFSRLLVNKFAFHCFDHDDINDKINPVENRELAEYNFTFELIWAASTGDMPEIRRLLLLGADINSRDYDNRTALHLAAAEGHTNIVTYLLSKKADTNATDRRGARPIDDARENNHTDIVKIFEEFEKITNNTENK